LNLTDKALQMAAVAHEGQYRKNTKVPYIAHPAAVGLILQKAGYKEELVTSGILHDTVEDTEITLDDIKREFGNEVAAIVAGCSEPDKSLSWEERKEHTIEYLKTAPEDIRIVACADKLHNVKSILLDIERDGEDVWTWFKRGREQQAWYYRNVIASLGAESAFPLLEELKLEVERLFPEE
jgi:(p)ppGpp synthase/HD superfamily hydrolase